ncbi:MAG TPA: D-hexose-6-phosphate mutarotase [Edaphobacter sp.]|nr:D-hexose-6-phosphate mutarotase [Edaphobacter sp.]
MAIFGKTTPAREPPFACHAILTGTMDIAFLTENFAIPGVLSFHKTESGFVYADVVTPEATAKIYLQGAQLAAWQPAGHDPVLFFSSHESFTPGHAMRGGVPICFPWFGARHDGKAGPAHGFARTQEWELAFAAVAGDDLHLTFTLGPTEVSRGLGYDNFRLVYELVIGRTLTMRLTAANNGAEPLVIEEALHTYFAVGDVREVKLTGLEPTAYGDKTDDMREKPAAHEPVTFTGETDRVYDNTAATCVIHDAAGRRRISVAKQNSHTTVVWNPWKEMADLGAEEWPKMLCVETANTAENAITLAQGQAHTMQAQVSVEEVEG